MILVAAVHGLKSVPPRRRIPVRITPYELRVALADRRHETRRYGRDADAVVTIATTTSGRGVPAWAADRIDDAAVESVEAAHAIAAEVCAPVSGPPRSGTGGRAPRRRSRVARLHPDRPRADAPRGGVDDARQAAYQRRLSGLLAGRRGTEA